MEAKVGVDGSAVTSSLDYKVAQQGLVLVKSQTIGSGVSSVTVTGAFSSTFDNYRIVVANIDASAAGYSLQLIFGAVTTGYYGSRYYDLYTGSGNSITRMNNASFIYGPIVGQNGDTYASLDVLMPNQATRTGVHGTMYGSGYTFVLGAQEISTTQHTAFTLTASLGTWTGGTIRVYGYNNG